MFLPSIILYVFGYVMNLVYLEVIELNCCGLNKNIKRKIQKRADKDNENQELYCDLKDDFSPKFIENINSEIN